MKLTAKEAYELHIKMWTAMQTELGDNPTAFQRIKFKNKWVKRNFPNSEVHANCFLCEFTKESDNELILKRCNCNRCILDWSSLCADGYVDMVTCDDEYYDYDYSSSIDNIYLIAPISEILALPIKEKYRKEIYGNT